MRVGPLLVLAAGTLVVVQSNEADDERQVEARQLNIFGLSVAQRLLFPLLMFTYLLSPMVAMFGTVVGQVVNLLRNPSSVQVSAPAASSAPIILTPQVSPVLNNIQPAAPVLPLPALIPAFPLPILSGSTDDIQGISSLASPLAVAGADAASTDSLWATGGANGASDGALSSSSAIASVDETSPADSLWAGVNETPLGSPFGVAGVGGASPADSLWTAGAVDSGTIAPSAIENICIATLVKCTSTLTTTFTPVTTATTTATNTQTTDLTTTLTTTATETTTTWETELTTVTSSIYFSTVTETSTAATLTTVNYTISDTYTETETVSINIMLTRSTFLTVFSSVTVTAQSFALRNSIDYWSSSDYSVSEDAIDEDDYNALGEKTDSRVLTELESSIISSFRQYI